MSEIKKLLVIEYKSKGVQEGQIFNFLYNEGILSTDYSALAENLSSAEISNDYGNFSVTTNTMDISDIDSEMESLMSELVKLN